MGKKRKSIGEILKKLGMYDSAEHYELERNVCSDMSGEILMNIYKEIKKGIGDADAEEFKKMVLDLPTVKASVLVDMLHNLENNKEEDGWWWWKEIYLKRYSPNLLGMPVCKDSERMKEEFKTLLNK